MALEKAQTSETYIVSEKGNKLFCRYWNEDNQLDKSNIKGLVFVIHGLAEHSLPYTELAELLIDQGLYVFAHDHVGHGQSEGSRCHVTDFQEYVKDCFAHVDRVASKFPNIPIFLLGHSMGGTIAIHLALERPKFFRGVVMIAPAVIIDKKVRNPIKEFVGRLVAKIMPQLHVAKLDPKMISGDPEMVKAYEDDPLNYHTGIKCGFAATFIDTLDRLCSRLEEVTWPYLLLHGDKDGLCAIEGSLLLHEKATSKDKQLKVFPDAYHQLHKEVESVKKETLALITEWIVTKMDVPA